jgi:hypothetical protein
LIESIPKLGKIFHQVKLFLDKSILAIFIGTTIPFYENMIAFKMHLRKKMHVISPFVMKSSINNATLLESQYDKL